MAKAFDMAKAFEMAARWALKSAIKKVPLKTFLVLRVNLNSIA